MAVRRRHDDPPEMDHTEDRVLDWKLVAPRWLLVTALVVSFGLNGALGSMLASSVTARLDQIQRTYADPKWDQISLHAERIGKLEARVQQEEGRITRLEEADVRQQILRLSMQFDELNRRLKAKGL